MNAVRAATLQITFRNLAPSVAVKMKVQELLTKLEGYGGRVSSCRVTVEALKAGPPSQMRYHVGVVAHVLGRALVADSELQTHFGGAYVYVPIHSAFDTIRRQLSTGIDAKGEQLLPAQRNAKSLHGATTTGPARRYSA